MASLLDNLGLGLAGVEDMVGIGNGHEAADTYAKQTVDAQVAAGQVSADDAAAAQAALQAKAQDAEANQDVLGKAVEQTRKQVEQPVKNALNSPWLKYGIPALVVIAGLALVAYVLTLARSFVPRRV